MCAVRAGGMDAVLREHTPPRAKRCFLVTSLHQQRSYPLVRAEALSDRIKKKRWIPAFAGMTSKDERRATGAAPAPPNPPLKGRALSDIAASAQSPHRPHPQTSEHEGARAQQVV